MAEWITGNVAEQLEITLGEFIGPRNIDFADIDEAIFLVKENCTDDDLDALLTKTIANSGLVKSSTSESLFVVFESADFNVLTPGETYRNVLRIKTASMSGYLPVSFKFGDNYKLEIVSECEA